MKARAISEVERVVRNTLARPVDSNTVELRAVCKAKCVVVRIWTVSADALSSVAVSIELSDPGSRVATRRVRDPPHSNLAEPAQGRGLWITDTASSETMPRRRLSNRGQQSQSIDPSRET